MKDLKSQKTYEEIAEFRRVAEMRLNLEREVKTKTKLAECIQDLIGNPDAGELGQFVFVQEKHNLARKKIYRQYASVDERKNIIKDAHNNYSYTKENEEACETALAELNKETIEFTPSYCPIDDLPRDLLSIEKKAYKGFVIE